MCKNVPKQHFIVHCNIYQEKNADDIRMPPDIYDFAIMQYAVVNSINQQKIHIDPTGKRRSFMDNHYTSASLFIILQEKFNIFGAGTTR